VGIKSFAIGTAVAAGGAWLGDLGGGFIAPMLPKGADGMVNPILEKVVRYSIIGLTVSTAIHLVKRKG
jgi:hypothetical protein